MTPALTTVRQPSREMGTIAMETTLHLIEGGTAPASIVLPGVLIERQSTAPPGVAG